MFGLDGKWLTLIKVISWILLPFVVFYVTIEDVIRKGGQT